MIDHHKVEVIIRIALVVSTAAAAAAAIRYYFDACFS